MRLRRKRLLEASIALSAALGGIGIPLSLWIAGSVRAPNRNFGGATDARATAVMAIDRSSLQLRPQEASSLLSVGLAHLTFEGLFTPTESGSVKAALCQQMWHDATFRQWRFQIKAARWSDGSLVTAHDFVRAINRAHDPQRPCAAAAAVAALDWTGPDHPVKAIDESNLMLRWAEMTPQAPALLASPAFFPMASGEDGLVTNGPYKVDVVIPGQGIYLLPNGTYRCATDTLPALRLLAMDQRTSLAAALSGQVDWIGSPWGATQLGIGVRLPNGWRQCGLWGRHWVRVNTRDPELRSPPVRQEIRRAILASVGNGVQPVGLLEDTASRCDDSGNVVTSARGGRLSLLFAPSYARDLQASLLQQSLQVAGWVLELCPVEAKTLAQRVSEGSYQLVLSSWVAESPLSDEMLKPWLSTNAAGNGTGWQVRESDELRLGRLEGRSSSLAQLEAQILMGAAVVPIEPMVMRSWSSSLLADWRLTPLGTFDLDSLGLREP